MREAQPLHPAARSQRARDLRMNGLALRHHFFSRTSSYGADQGYGLMSMSAGSATRGPMPLGQTYSKIGA